MFRAGLAASLTLALVMGASAQPTLDLQDLTLGTSATPPFAFRAIPFHQVRIRLTGSALARTVLAASTTPAPSGLTFNGTTVEVDPANLVLIWDGISNPASPIIGQNGLVEVVVTIPWPAPIGDLLFIQAAVIPVNGLPQLTNGSILRWSGEAVDTVEFGSLTTHPLGIGGGAQLMTDGPTFATFWGLHAGPTALPPPIDFNTNFVYARFLGQYLFPNIWVTVDEMLLDPAQVLHVYVTQHTGGIQPPASIVQPYMIVSAPRTLLGASYQEELRQAIYP